MVKEIEIYNGKKVTVDFEKVYEYICKCFSIFLFMIYILLPDKEMGLGVVSCKNTILLIVTAGAFITLISTYILQGSFKVDRYIVVLGIYLALIILSGINSKYPENVWFGINGRYEGIVTLACYFVAFYIFYKGFSYSEKLFNFVTIAVIVVCFHGLLQVFLNKMGYIVSEHPGMAYSNFTNPNMFSSFLTLFLPIYLVRYFCYDKKNNYFLYICSIIFAALVCTKTFGGYLTFAIYFTVLSIYFICISKDRKKMLIKVLKILLIFLVIYILLNMFDDFKYSNEIVSNTKSIKKVIKRENVEQFGHGRMYIWNICLEIVAKYPIFGVGPDSLGSEMILNYVNRENYLFENTDVADKAHNEYLHVAVTTGIPSLIVYLVFLTMIVIGLIMKYRKYVKNGEILEKRTMLLVAVAASIGSYLFQASGNISIFAMAPLFWSMLGIGAKISNKDYE